MNFSRFWGSPVEIFKIFFVTNARVSTVRAHSYTHSLSKTQWHSAYWTAHKNVIDRLSRGGLASQFVRLSKKNKPTDQCSSTELNWLIGQFDSCQSKGFKFTWVCRQAFRYLAWRKETEEQINKKNNIHLTPEIIRSGGTYFCSFTQLLTFSTTSSLSLCSRSPLARASSSDTRRVCT